MPLNKYSNVKNRPRKRTIVNQNCSVVGRVGNQRDRPLTLIVVDGIDWVSTKTPQERSLYDVSTKWFFSHTKHGLIFPVIHETPEINY